jgi:hypothetical protein
MHIGVEADALRHGDVEPGRSPCHKRNLKVDKHVPVLATISMLLDHSTPSCRVKVSTLFWQKKED